MADPTVPATTDPTSTPVNPAGTALDQYQASLVANPVLPNGTSMTASTLPTDQASQQASGQLMSTSDTGVTMQQTPAVTAPATQPAAPTIQQTQGTAATVDPNQIPNQAGLTQASSGYNAMTVGAAQGTAAQGQINPLDTVAGQLTALYAQTGVGQVPTWAAGAVAAANSAMAARGMGASSVGAAAIVAAVQNSALPIASQDASTYFQMDMQNLSNSQQMAMQNLQNQQQSLLSDQAAVNAASQFNASNYTQVQEFMGTLVSNIQTQNADRLTAMSQFNAGQANTIATQDVANQINTEEFTSQQQAAIDQFNASQTFAVNQFNAQAAYAIDQSNATWQRNIATQNTAAINAQNQVNAQNAFNLSQTALNNLWQQWRDNVAYSFTQSQNQASMNFDSAMAANNQQFASPSTNFNWAQAAGAFATSVLVG